MALILLSSTCIPWVETRPVNLGGGLNTGRVYTGSGKIQVRCISGLGKIRVECILVLWVLDEPNGFRAPFPGLFFCQNKKFDIFIT